MISRSPRSTCLREPGSSYHTPAPTSAAPVFPSPPAGLKTGSQEGGGFQLSKQPPPGPRFTKGLFQNTPKPSHPSLMDSRRCLGSLEAELELLSLALR